MLTQQDLDVLVRAGVLACTDEPGVYRVVFNPHPHTPEPFAATEANRPPWAYEGKALDDVWRREQLRGLRKAIHRSRVNLKLVKGGRKQ